MYAKQVLGQTLSRLARGQVAEAWKAELKAREHESRLLEELEVNLLPPLFGWFVSVMNYLVLVPCRRGLVS